MRRSWLTGTLGFLGLWLCCEAVSALPAFARRYQVSCSLCHAGFPKLNNVGQRFKERGFRLERETAEDASAWLRSLPISGRAAFSHAFVEDADSVSEGMLRLESAGNLGGRFSFWIDDGVRFYRTDDDAPSHLEPNDAYLRYELSRKGGLYARAGRMEMDLPFTQARSPHLFAYDPYYAFGPDPLGGHKDGVELGGHFKGDARWSFGLFAGDDSESSDDLSFFIRAVVPYRLHRFGLFSHLGTNAPTNASFQRYGLDWNLWFNRLNVYGLTALGKYRGDRTISGALLQSDYHLEERVAITARVSLVNRPRRPPSIPAEPPVVVTGRETDFGFYPGVQVWVMPRLRLSFEYGFLNREHESGGRLQAELAL